MRRGRWILLLFSLASVALAVVGVASHRYPMTWRFAPSDTSRYMVEIGAGLVRLGRIVAKPRDEYMGPAPLDEYLSYGWKKRSPLGGPFGWNTRSSTRHEGTEIGEIEIYGSLFFPLVVTAVAALIYWMGTPRGRLVWREVYRTSNGTSTWGMRRLVRTVFVLTCGLGLSFVMLLWLVNLWGLPTQLLGRHQWGSRYVDVQNPGTIWYGNRRSAGFSSESAVIGFVGGGHVEVFRTIPVPRKDAQRDRRHSFAGFAWNKSALSVVCGPDMTDKDQDYIESLRMPLWAPTVLFAFYPLLAFVRGPWRRSGRRLRGLCTRCGYSTVGLPEPRCPECGTAVTPLTVPPALAEAG